MMERDSETLVTGATTTTSSSLDERLSLIKAYLMDQLAERGASRRATAERAVRIDLEVLGIGITAENVAGTWKNQAVYPIRLSHSSILLGPLYRPDQGGPCPRCLEQRWLALRPREVKQALDARGQGLVFGSNPWLASAALESLWAVVESILCQRCPPVPAQYSAPWFCVLHLVSLHLTRYQLLADALCPVCSTPQPDTPGAASLQLASRPKREVFAYHPLEVTAYPLPVSGLLNPVCGLLGASAFPVYTQPLNAQVRGQFPVTVGQRRIEVGWAGHANSYDRSVRLGLLEGLERSAAQRPRGKTVSVFDSYDHLQPDALDPRACGVYHEDYYRAAFPTFLPFRPDRPLPWVWGYSFRQARPLLVPEQLAYCLDIREDAPPLCWRATAGVRLGGLWRRPSSSACSS